MRKVGMCMSIVVALLFAVQAFAGPQGRLVMFHAGSLCVPFDAMEKAFEAEYPKVDPLREASGTQKAAIRSSGAKSEAP